MKKKSFLKYLKKTLPQLAFVDWDKKLGWREFLMGWTKEELQREMKRAANHGRDLQRSMNHRHDPWFIGIGLVIFIILLLLGWGG